MPRCCKNASEAEIQALLARQFIENPHKLPTSVNAYLINTGAKLILIDAGGGNLCGPAMGNLPKNLKAAGYQPEQVDAVLLTHLHPDHVGGLLDAAGQAGLPQRRRLRLEAGERLLALDGRPGKGPARVPPASRRGLKLVRKVAAPYLAAGRWKTFSGAELPIAGLRRSRSPATRPATRPMKSLPAANRS